MSWEQPRQARGARWWRPGGVVALLLAVAALALSTRGSPAPRLTVSATLRPVDPGVADGSTELSTLRPTRMDPVEVSTDRAGGAPLLPDVDLTVVTADFVSRLQIVDVATGRVRGVAVFAPTARARPLAMVSTDDSVIIDANGDVVRLRDGQTRPTVLARDHRSIPTADDDSLWVFDGVAAVVGGTASRVGFDGSVLDRVALPAVARPLAGTADSLVVALPGTVSRIDADGSRHEIAHGEALASDGVHLARLDCSAGLACAVVIGTVSEPDQVEVQLAPTDRPAGLSGVPGGAFSPDGRWFALPLHRGSRNRPIDDSSISIISVATGVEVLRLPGSPLRPLNSPMAWSPDGRWLALSTGSRVQLWDTEGGDVTELAVPLSPIYALAVR